MQLGEYVDEVGLNVAKSHLQPFCLQQVARGDPIKLDEALLKPGRRCTSTNLHELAICV